MYGGTRTALAAARLRTSGSGAQDGNERVDLDLYFSAKQLEEVGMDGRCFWMRLFFYSRRLGPAARLRPTHCEPCATVYGCALCCMTAHAHRQPLALLTAAEKCEYAWVG